MRGVCVLGDGVPAALAALAIARAYRRLGVAVTWVARGVAPPPHEALAAPPDMRAFHRLLGLDEGELLRRTPATLDVGRRFAGWSGGDHAFTLGHGEAGRAYASLPFVQHWTRARRAGLRVALEEFSLSAVAARSGRIRIDGDASPYGYHLDAAAYAALLRRLCVAAGVRVAIDADPHVAATNDHIEAIALRDGERVTADLFVDTDGALIDALDPHGRCDAPPFCDRVVLASAPPPSPLPPFSRTTAHRAGWITLTPLRDRTAIHLAYVGAFMGDEEAGALLRSVAGRTAAGPPISISVGHRPRSWVGNCVAIGPAAGEPEALDAAPLLSLQLAIGQLVLLFPIDRDDMAEAALYNEEVAGQRARTADFSHLHFRLNGRVGEPFWDAARARPVSPELSAKIDLFAARGMFAHFNHEAHTADGWAMAMAGHGITPLSSDPQVDSVPEEGLMLEFQRQLRAVAQAVGAMETHEAALARLMRPAR